MKTVERRLRVLETAAGVVGDYSFCALARRANARGESVPRITIQPDETVEEVAAREDITEDQALVARIIVDPKHRRRR